MSADLPDVCGLWVIEGKVRIELHWRSSDSSCQPCRAGTERPRRALGTGEKCLFSGMCGRNSKDLGDLELKVSANSRVCCSPVPMARHKRSQWLFVILTKAGLFQILILIVQQGVQGCRGL